MRFHSDSGWLAVDAEEIARAGRAPRGDSFACANQLFGKFAAAVGHVLAAEHAEPEHLRGRELRLELRIEIAAGRRAQRVAIALLHLVVDGDGALAHRRN